MERLETTGGVKNNSEVTRKGRGEGGWTLFGVDLLGS